MKTLELNSYQVTEMTHSDMVITEGGSWLSRAWDNISYVAGIVADAIYDAVVWISNNAE